MFNKKINFITAIAVIAAMSLTACGKEEVQKTQIETSTSSALSSSSPLSAEKPIQNTGRDLTAKFTSKYDSFNPADFKVRTMGYIAEYLFSYNNIGELWAESSYVIHGTVRNIRYFDGGGAAQAFCDFEVEESYKDGLNTGNIITVATSEGYIRMEKEIERYGNDHYQDLSEEEIKNTVFRSRSMAEPPSLEIGKKYLLFLYEPQKGYPDLVDGDIYYEINEEQGRYYYNSKGKLERYCYDYEGEGEELVSTKPTYTFEEIDKILKNME